MKRVLGIIMVVGLGWALTVMVGSSKAAMDGVGATPTGKNQAKGLDKNTGKKGKKKDADGQKKGEVNEDLGKGIKLDLVLIPAGKFMMGSPASEKGRSMFETQREVTLTKPYYMGKYEVTQEQWQAVMGNNPSSTRGAKLPVTDISWEDCQEFIKKLNAKTNRGYRLPTEAEWEYACRSGTTTAYSFGDNLTKSDANIDNLMGSIKAVGSYRANAFGLYDMHGNVSEWCNDWFAWKYPVGAVVDPQGPPKGVSRVMRGGSFNFEESGVRSSIRLDQKSSDGGINFGFRLAWTK